MRIVSGKYKSRKLAPFKHSSELRPTTDKIKEAVFDILGDKVVNKNFLDLFAGTGQIGIEAISRGAKRVFFVEKYITNINLIKKNLQLLKIDQKKFKIFIKDALKFLYKSDELENIDVVFVDPPYNKGFIEKIIKALKFFTSLNKENLIILEHSKEEKFFIDESFDIIKQKSYGDTKVTFLSKIF